MTDLLPGRTARSDVEVRLTLFGIGGVLLVVVLGIAYLLVPTEWVAFPALFFWMLPSVLLAVGLSLAEGQYILESLRLLRQEVVRWRELARTREEERDLAQDEIVRRLQQERELGRQKVQFEAQLAAYEKYAALAQLALGAAHEINNPLLGISSHLELELKTAGDLEQREEIEQCIAGTRRISSTIQGLINYARPGPLMLGKIHLGRMVEETLSFVRHQPMFRRLTIDSRIAPELPQITADVNQLSQILMNLLLNAAQATPEGGSITITAQKIKFADAVELAVVDTGEGIPADILPHIFEPFFTTKRGKGTGLGLSISHAYVRSHGGDIRVDSIPGRGTTVRVTMPVRQEGRVSTQEVEEMVV
jgi:signal transduction histidine kinase